MTQQNQSIEASKPIDGEIIESSSTNIVSGSVPTPEVGATLGVDLFLRVLRSQAQFDTAKQEFLKEADALIMKIMHYLIAQANAGSETVSVEVPSKFANILGTYFGSQGFTPMWFHENTGKTKLQFQIVPFSPIFPEAEVVSE